MTAGSANVRIVRNRDASRRHDDDAVAVEEPLEIRLGYSADGGRAVRSLSITMRTPGNDAELAAGFLLSESIISRAADIASIEPCAVPSPATGRSNVIRAELGGDVAVDLSRLQRHFYTTSSCGVCGKASLEALSASGCASLADDETAFPAATLLRMPGLLRKRQRTFDETGGLHAAGAFTPAGELVAVREDVGRHNAVDKLAGHLLLEGKLPAAGLGLIVSGRASFELMQKALTAGFPLLAAVSAPSSLAVELAREFDMTLVGFLRGRSFNIYAGERRVC